MDKKRAKEIIQSKGVIDVAFNGASVWIDSLYKDNAKVTFLVSKNTMEVPVSKLYEEQ